MASIEVEALLHYGKYLGDQIRKNCAFYLSNDLDKVVKKLIDKGATEQAAELTENYT